MESLYTIAIKNLLPHGTMVTPGDTYDEVIVEDGVVKPSAARVDLEISNIRNSLAKRQLDYPTPEEWILALVQKELDNDSSHWDKLVDRRTRIKNKYKKSTHEGIEVNNGI